MKVIRVHKASSFFEKFLGLMFKREYTGCLLLEHCRSIHTFWMFFSIDLICLSGEGAVLAVKKTLQPWRVFCAPSGTQSIIECSAESSTIGDIAVGDSVTVEVV